jgi:hypothetical protein
MHKEKSFQFFVQIKLSFDIKFNYLENEGVRLSFITNLRIKQRNLYLTYYIDKHLLVLSVVEALDES